MSSFEFDAGDDDALFSVDVTRSPSVKSPTSFTVPSNVLLTGEKPPGTRDASDPGLDVSYTASQDATTTSAVADAILKAATSQSSIPSFDEFFGAGDELLSVLVNAEAAAGGLDTRKRGRDTDAPAGVSPAVTPPPPRNLPPPTNPAAYSWALVCACNMNRSMAGHRALVSNGFTRVASYGTSSQVRLPRRNARTYDFPFGTAYSAMLASIQESGPDDVTWAEAARLPQLLQRNTNIKRAPASWQGQSVAELTSHDVVICLDATAFATVLADLKRRSAATGAPPQQLQHTRGRALPQPAWRARAAPTHVVLVDTPDNIEAAEANASHIRRFAERITRAGPSRGFGSMIRGTVLQSALSELAAASKAVRHVEVQL